MATLQTPPPRNSPLRTVALAIWTAMVLVAVLVLWRGLSGALTQPVPSPVLGLWCLSGVLLSHWAGICLESSSGSSHAHWLGWGAALLFGGAWWPVAAPLQAGLIAGVLLLYGGLLAARGLVDELLRWPVAAASDVTADVPAPTLFDEAEPAGNDSSDVADEAAADGADQWLVRRREGDAEICEGHQRVTFSEGQREATVHIALCPPLPVTPQVELDDSDGLGWELKVAAAYPYGIRIAVRRPVAQTAAQSGRIAWWASARTSGRSAA